MSLAILTNKVWSHLVLFTLVPRNTISMYALHKARRYAKQIYQILQQHTIHNRGDRQLPDMEQVS